MPDGPHWVEAHTAGHFQRLAAWRMGVLAIGDSQTIWAYPTNYANPWTQRSPKTAHDIAASPTALYAVEPSGAVSRMVDDRWTTFSGSTGWGASAVAASEDDQVFVIARGRVYRVDAGGLVPGPCPDITASAIGAAGRDDLYAIDQTGLLHRGTGGNCLPVSTPTSIRSVAASGGRVVIVTTLGAVLRRRGEEAWIELPQVRKYRSNVWPAAVQAAQVTLSAHSTWILDRQGAAFVLSDET